MSILQQESVSNILNNIKEIVKKDSNNLIISTNREKNIKFLKEYSLKKKDVIQIINELNIKHFISKVKNKHEDYSHEYLYIFKIDKVLVDTKGLKSIIPIYLKFNLISPKVILISIHKAEY